MDAPQQNELALQTQNVIESGFNNLDISTSRIFLSPRAEKQWREDFSLLSCVAKIFAISIADNSERNIYVNAFARNSLSFLEENSVPEKLANSIGGEWYVFNGATHNTPPLLPNNFAKLEYDYNHIVYNRINKNISFSYISRQNIVTDGILRSIARLCRILSGCEDFALEDAETFHEKVEAEVKRVKKDRAYNLEYEINDFKKKLKISEDNYEQLQKSIEDINNNSNFIHDQIEIIRRFPSVESVEYYSNYLRVNTNMLDIGVTDKNWMDGEWDGVTIPLGKFTIEFNLTKIFNSPAYFADGVFFYNKTMINAGSNLVHPHITSPNNACYSQWSENFKQAAENSSIINLVSNAINYLRTFNPEDEYGANIRDFDDNGIFSGVTDDGKVEGENGDYDRPGYGGYWEWYDPGHNGEWRSYNWEWYEDQINGEYRDSHGCWIWYDDAECENEGYWTNGQFIFYEDDDDYEYHEESCAWLTIDEINELDAQNEQEKETV